MTKRINSFSESMNTRNKHGRHCRKSAGEGFHFFLWRGRNGIGGRSADKGNTRLQQNDINTPEINVTVSFIHLWQSPEYESFSTLEKVSLCDTVKVYHPSLIWQMIFFWIGLLYQPAIILPAIQNVIDIDCIVKNLIEHYISGFNKHFMIFVLLLV